MPLLCLFVSIAASFVGIPKYSPSIALEVTYSPIVLALLYSFLALLLGILIFRAELYKMPCFTQLDHVVPTYHKIL